MLSLLPALEDYVVEHTSPESELLERLREETQRDIPMPQMQVGSIEGTFLKLLVALSGARNVLEIGTFTGYSGICMASALPADGKLITCDVDTVATAVARRYYDESGYGDKIEIKLAPALETIAALPADLALDMVFIDADKENYSAYYDAVFDRVPPGGLIVADNTLWSGRVLRPQTDSARAIAAYNAKVASDPRVDHVLLAVRDGIMLTRKKAL